MTISSQQGRQSYAGAGTTGPFAVPFKFFANSDLKVIKQSSAGVDATLTQNVDYTVTGAGNELGGSVTTTANVAVGETLSIILDPPRTQQTDYVSNDAFPAESHERALDRLTQQNIRVRDQVSRALRQADGDFQQIADLPGRAVRAGLFLGFNGQGDPTVLSGTGNDAALRTDLASAAIAADGALLVGYRRTEGGSVVRTVAAKLRDIVSARDFGFATGALAASNTAALQSAIDAMAAAGGGIVWLPEGAFNFAGNIDLKQGVTVRGAGPFATVLTCTTAGVHGLKAAAALSGVGIMDLQLVGTNAANANEDGIHIVGDASGGFPKLLLSNLLVKQWGNVGVSLESCFGALVEGVNSSSNKSHGHSYVACFGMSALRIEGFQNDGHGALVRRAAGSFFSGIMQENKKNGWLGESMEGCIISTYVEQNGWSTATDNEKAQIRLTQAVGFAVSSGCKLFIFALGGKGSIGPTMESKYGAYFDFCVDSEVNGSLGGHLDSDIFFTTNSAGNSVGSVTHKTGLPGDTPNRITNNGIIKVSITPFVEASAGVANVGVGEDDLMTYSLPANTLFLNKQAIEITAWGNTGNNVNNKRVRLYFGATVIWDSGALAAQSQDWVARVIVVRLSNTSQQSIVVSGHFNNAYENDDVFKAPAETLSNAVTIKCTGEGTADGDITQRGLIVRGL